MIYKTKIEIVGDLWHYGKAIDRKGWFRKLNEQPYKVVVNLVSQDPTTNFLLERVIDLGTTGIRFPDENLELDN